jgi:hypothetical protein
VFAPLFFKTSPCDDALALKVTLLFHQDG